MQYSFYDAVLNKKTRRNDGCSVTLIEKISPFLFQFSKFLTMIPQRRQMPLPQYVLGTMSPYPTHKKVMATSHRLLRMLPYSSSWYLKRVNWPNYISPIPLKRLIYYAGAKFWVMYHCFALVWNHLKLLFLSCYCMKRDDFNVVRNIQHYQEVFFYLINRSTIKKPKNNGIRCFSVHCSGWNAKISHVSCQHTESRMEWKSTVKKGAWLPVLLLVTK